MGELKISAFLVISR